MASEVVVFDPNKMAEAMRDKIRMEILNIIPPESWDAMVKKEIKSFCEDSNYSNYSGNKTTEAPLKTMIKEEISKKLKEEITSLFNSPEWTSSVWENNRMVNTSELVKKIAIEAGPALVTKMMENIAMNAVQQAVNSIRSGIVY